MPSKLMMSLNILLVCNLGFNKILGLASSFYKQSSHKVTKYELPEGFFFDVTLFSIFIVSFLLNLWDHFYSYRNKEQNTRQKPTRVDCRHNILKIRFSEKHTFCNSYLKGATKPSGHVVDSDIQNQQISVCCPSRTWTSTRPVRFLLCSLITRSVGNEK